MDELLGSPSNRLGRAGKGDELNLAEVLRLLLRHKFLLVTLVISAVSAALVEHSTFPSYQTKTQLFIQSVDNNPLQAITAKLSGMGLGNDGVGREFPEKYLLHLRSFDFYLSAAKQLRANSDFKSIKRSLFVQKGKLQILKERFLGGVKTINDEALTDERIAEMLLHWVNFGRNGQDSISILVTTPDKKLTLMLANVLADIAADAINDHELKEVNEAQKFIQAELDEAEKAIKETDESIVEFKQSNKLLSLESPQGESVSRAVELKKELEGVRIEFEQNEKLMESLTKQLREQDGYANPGDTKFGVARRINELRRENQVLGVRRATVKKVLDDLLRSQDPHYEQRVFDLRKKMELEYSLFQELKHELFQVGIQRIVVKNRVRTLDKARDFEVRPSVSLIRKLMIAAVVALLIGGPTAYAWELVMPTVKSRTDLEEANLIFLGGIPDLSKPIHKKHRIYFLNRKEDLPLMCRFDIDSPGSMALKHIRTRILHLAEAGQVNLQVISILSATMGEGKSFTSRNLAACIAHMKKKVLLIDCDFRRGTTSEFFRTSHMQGLSDILTSSVSFISVVNCEVVPNLDLLPSGSHLHGTTEILANPRFGEVIRDLRSRYDFIILDTPPLIPPPDASLISKHADMLVLLATYNRTTRENLDTAIDYLLDVNQKRVYGILNKIEGMEDYVYVMPQSSGLRGKAGEKNKVL